VPNNRLTVGIDLDGVMYDFTAALARWVHTTTGRPLATMPQPATWNTWEHWDMSCSEFLAHMAEGIDAGFVFADGTPYPGAVDAVRSIAAAGHRVEVVTDRGAGDPRSIATVSTRAWLAAHGVPHHSVTFTADKTAVHVDAFIDDRDVNFVALLEHGSNPYLLDRPWNRHVDAGARRLTSMTAFAAAVHALAA
jgi:hypothetical protein